MKQISLPFVFVFFIALTSFAQQKHVLVIHGGAGTILKENMTPELEVAYTAALTQSLKAGYEQLQLGNSSADAVIAAIKVMEDSPLFNSGKGAVFTHDGKNELDASIMLGHTRAAGAVAGVTTIKSPIEAAKAVMEKSEHVMMTGKGAEEFAASVGLEIVDPSYFYTESRWNALQRAIKRDSLKAELDHDGDNKQGAIREKSNRGKTSVTHQLADTKSNEHGPMLASPLKNELHVDEKYGTVGAVAIDKQGHIAAGTSTGGMTNKKFGRIGDSPIIGAGTYANEQVGISCTGWGEFFIRSIAAYDIAALMDYQKLSVTDASRQVIDKIGVLGGDGGVIALDKDGNVAMPFNTAGMYRGTITDNGEVNIEIYK